MEWVIFGYPMVWVDIVLVLVALLYAWQAFERGLVAVLCEFTAWVMAWMVGLLIIPLLANVLVTDLGSVKIEALEWGILISVVVGQILGYRVLTKLTHKLPRHFFSPAIQVIIAVGPAIANGIFFAGLILLVLITLPFSFPLKEELLTSQSAQYLLVTRSLFGNL